MPETPPASLEAVLTGDIARSSALPAQLRSRLPTRLRAISEEVRAFFPAAGCPPMDIFRGDSWQLLVEKPALALRIAVFVRARLRAAFAETRVDTRIAVGFGTVDFVPEADISGGDGTAFRRSGQALDQMERGFRMAVAAAESLGEPTGSLLDAVAKLIDVEATKWTQRQAYAVGKALTGLTQDEIGAEWIDRPISQQTVAQHLAAAGWNALEYALSASETVFDPA